MELSNCSKLSPNSTCPPGKTQAFGNEMFWVRFVNKTFLSLLIRTIHVATFKFLSENSGYIYYSKQFLSYYQF